MYVFTLGISSPHIIHSYLTSPESYITYEISLGMHYANTHYHNTNEFRNFSHIS